jgi:hypothetical protein
VGIYVVVLWVTAPIRPVCADHVSEHNTACIFGVEALRWSQYIPPKRRYPITTLYGVIMQKTTIWNICSFINIIIIMIRRGKLVCLLKEINS